MNLISKGQSDFRNSDTCGHRGVWGCCLVKAVSVASGLGDCDLTKLGIPTAEEYFRMYCLHMGIPPTENWNFYMAFSFFRIAAILQGVYKRSLTGTGGLGRWITAKGLLPQKPSCDWTTRFSELNHLLLRVYFIYIYKYILNI